jgi:hypothetical protein
MNMLACELLPTSASTTVIAHWDIESRSVVRLDKAGPWRYAADPATTVLCVAYAIGDEQVKTWLPGDPAPLEFAEIAQNPNWLLCSHNAQFELAILQKILRPRHGWPRIPLARFRCTMATGLALALPGKLELIAEALELLSQKDKAGQRLMLMMAKPRKARKDEEPDAGPYWFDHEDRLQRLYEYCRQDVEVERELYAQLQPLISPELEFWQLDAIINARGFHFDRTLALAARKIAQALGPEINAGTTAQYSIDEIERIVREGAPEGANRSNTFHGIVGRFLGCGWSIEQITNHLDEFPDGIGSRYIAENRLAREVERSAAAFSSGEPASTESWNAGFHKGEAQEEQPAEDPPDPELEEETGPELPPMYGHGDPDPRPVKSWAVKGLLQAQGHGLLSGQWGTYKSFIALELAGSLMTGQPFLDRLIKRQCGVLFLAAEGQHEMRLRLAALVREKCGGITRAPFRWFEDIPVLLQPDGLALLVAMGRQAAASLQQEFGLPLGLVIIDTIAASAGYVGLGAENDNAINQRLMNVLKLAAQQLDWR